jgi:hypothetical protein
VEWESRGSLYKQTHSKWDANERGIRGKAGGPS